MKTPRDCSGAELVKALKKKLGYEVARQDGSHIRVTTKLNGEHHLTIPNHKPVKVGLLHDILKDIAEHHRKSVEDLIVELAL